MLKRSTFIALFAATFALAAPAFADGTGKGPTYNAPAPLTPQSYTIYPNRVHTTVQSTPHHSTVNCHTPCGHTSSHISHSGLATNPRPNCHSGCSHTPPPTVYIPPPVTHKPPPVMTQMRAGDVISLDSATIASMSGGVGVGVNDVFVGGGGFGSGFTGGSFGLRSSGFFAVRNASFQGSRRSFRGGKRGGFRGGRGGGRRGGGKK